MTFDERQMTDVKKDRDKRKKKTETREDCIYATAIVHLFYDFYACRCFAFITIFFLKINKDKFVLLH